MAARDIVEGSSLVSLCLYMITTNLQGYSDLEKCHWLHKISQVDLVVECSVRFHFLWNIHKDLPKRQYLMQWNPKPFFTCKKGICFSIIFTIWPQSENYQILIKEKYTEPNCNVWFGFLQPKSDPVWLSSLEWDKMVCTNPHRNIEYMKCNLMKTLMDVLRIARQIINRWPVTIHLIVNTFFVL